MNDKSELHVSQIGENWEVEDSAQTLAQAETKEEAIDAAKDAAHEKQAAKIVVHTSDGKIDTEIPVTQAQ
jgi:hypothetical protein